jgi:hypothetical protein
MSLKAEQRLDENQFTEFTPKIYATGVYLVPMKVENRYVWVAEEFDNDSWFDGENISPNVCGTSVPDILNQ